MSTRNNRQVTLKQNKLELKMINIKIEINTSYMCLIIH